jgi:hypothetical protein
MVVFLLGLIGAVLVVQDANAVAPACAKPVRTVLVRVPAPLEITTPCAVYTISSLGPVTVAERPDPREGITWMQIAGPSAQVVQRGARIAVLHAGREVWRSTGSFRAAAVFATLGPHAVAFGDEDLARGDPATDLYVAPLNGRERKVAKGEQPLGWTASGRLLTWKFRRGFFDLYVHKADGSLLARAGARLRELRFQPATRTVLALSRSDVLERYDDHWQRVADLRALGFGRHASFEPLAGGLIGVLEDRHAAVLRHDGALFASARFARRQRAFSLAGQSGLVANAAGTAVAFAVTSGDDGYASVGRESLYVLRAGDRSPREVYSGALRFAVCERWASLDWHDDWLLYATTEGKTLALDSRTPARSVDLTRLVARFASIDAEGKLNAQVQWMRVST